MFTRKLVVLLSLSLIICVVTFHHPAAQQEANTLARKVFAIFQESCKECHGDHGEDKDKFWLNYQAMIKDKTVISKKPDDSLIYTIIKTGKMPRDGTPLSAGQIADIRKWILEGARDWNLNNEKPAQ